MLKLRPRKRPALWGLALFPFGSHSNQALNENAESLLSAALRGLRGLVAAHVGEQLYLHPAILLAAFGGGVGGHFLVLANADQVEAVRVNAVLCGQVLNHGVGATLA
jgi:hypothetical protein